MKFNYLFTAILALGLALGACKKDDPEPAGPPPPTDEEILSEKAWQISETKIVDSANDTSTVNIIGSADWRLTFKKDGTGVVLGTLLQSGEFTWNFNSTKTQVNVTKGATNISYDYSNKNLLIGVLQNVTLTVVDSNGNPIGTLTGDVIETYIKVP